MPKPISRRELIRRLRLLGYNGPFTGKRHSLMRKGQHSVPIPNPHGQNLDWSLVELILRHVAIDAEDWDRLK